MPDKAFSLPDLTYSERELLMQCLLMRMGRLREFTPISDHGEINRIQDLYNKIQSHF